MCINEFEIGESIALDPKYFLNVISEEQSEAGARYSRDVQQRSCSLTGLSYLLQVPC